MAITVVTIIGPVISQHCRGQTFMHLRALSSSPTCPTMFLATATTAIELFWGSHRAGLHHKLFCLLQDLTESVIFPSEVVAPVGLASFKDSAPT